MLPLRVPLLLLLFLLLLIMLLVVLLLILVLLLLWLIMLMLLLLTLLVLRLIIPPLLPLLLLLLVVQPFSPLPFSLPFPLHPSVCILRSTGFPSHPCTPLHAILVMGLRTIMPHLPFTSIARLRFILHRVLIHPMLRDVVLPLLLLVPELTCLPLSISSPGAIPPALTLPACLCAVAAERFSFCPFLLPPLLPAALAPAAASCSDRQQPLGSR